MGLFSCCKKKPSLDTILEDNINLEIINSDDVENVQERVAVVVGINYKGLGCELKGCIDDSKTIKSFLKNTLHFKEEEIIHLTDETDSKPTKENIITALEQTVELANKGTKEIWFYYSGHGSFVFDHNGDEDDFCDEVIVPIDFRRSGIIADDELNKVIRKLPKDCKMISLFDCCHSGTALDLKYRYVGSTENATEHNENACDADITFISGSMDDQVSMEVYGLVENKYSGAMTNAFMDSVKKGEGQFINSANLLTCMRDYLTENNMDQIPQLSSSRKIDENSVFLHRNLSLSMREPKE